MKSKIRFALIALAAVELAALGVAYYSSGTRTGESTVSVGSKVSAFSRDPFSADMTITGKQGSYHGKMYAGQQALRTDVEMHGSGAASVIVRYDKNLEWILMPGQHYIEAPIEERTDLLSALRDPKATVTKQDVGPEKVGTYACEKYRVQASSQGKNHSGWIWVAKAGNMNGFIVKAQDQSSKETIEFSQIRLASPNPSVFDLPAGYQKLTEPSKAQPDSPQSETAHPAAKN